MGRATDSTLPDCSHPPSQPLTTADKASRRGTLGSTLESARPSEQPRAKGNASCTARCRGSVRRSRKRSLLAAVHGSVLPDPCPATGLRQDSAKDSSSASAVKITLTKAAHTALHSKRKENLLASASAGQITLSCCSQGEYAERGLQRCCHSLMLLYGL